MKDSFTCARELGVCAKCGKKEVVISPFSNKPETPATTENQGSNNRGKCQRKEDGGEDSDADTDSDDKVETLQ